SAIEEVSERPICDCCGKPTAQEQLRWQSYYRMAECPTCYAESLKAQAEDERVEAMRDWEECRCTSSAEGIDASRCPFHDDRTIGEMSPRLTEAIERLTVQRDDSREAGKAA